MPILIWEHVRMVLGNLHNESEEFNYKVLILLVFLGILSVCGF